jgi:aldehyde:ferredoxin oxidoreductase
MDTISLGMTLAFAFECYEKGVITRADTGGLELRFGDADLMIQLLEMTARREGLGDLLAEGSDRLARQWKVTDQPYYLGVKGQEIPMHDPRVKVGVGMGYAIATYGADHMNAAHDTLFTDDKFLSFQFIKPLGVYKALPATEISWEKVRMVALLDTLWKVQDALGLCVFGYAPRGVMPVEKMVQCLNAITGWDASLYELMKAAERGTMMAHAFNSREGFSIKDDRLPKRLFDPKPDGPNAGKKIFEEKDFNQSIEWLYEIMGVDPQTGRPHQGKLIELGLEWVEEILNKR